MRNKTLPLRILAGRFDLYLFHLKTGTLGDVSPPIRNYPAFSRCPCCRDTPPKHYWNTLNPESSTGNFISLNSYLSADDPHGHISSPISQVRVFT